ncbi:MAG: ribose-phosphate pyrophosphokinase, partial [Clostridia bacterium]|nr:ribose-phosphate pyrophosphokinase [Clostridia bacterium]
KFDEMYEKKVFDKIFTTNLIYGSPALKEREWYHSVNMCKYVSLLIDTLNHDKSISPLLKPIDRINKLLSTLPPERRN